MVRVIHRPALCRYNDELRRGEIIMAPNVSKLPLYVLTGVYYLMTAPRSVRRLQKRLLART